VPGELAEGLRRRKGFKVEIDVTATSSVCSASLRAGLADDAVRRAVAGQAPVSSLFTPEQRRFVAEQAPQGIVLDELCIFGPILVLKHTHTPPTLGRPLTLELWSDR
jgi:hypothetical protein